MRILNFLFAVMFLLFAFVQIDDPDPVLWIAIYGGMAVLAILAMFQIYPRIIIVALLIAFVGYSLTMMDGVREWLSQEDKTALFEDVAKMEHYYIEVAREFLGLVICMAVLTFYLIQSIRLQRSSARVNVTNS